MRDALLPVLLAALVLSCLTTGTGSAIAQTAGFAAAGTDPAQVTAFLKSLQSAVALGNRTKVASFFHFPLTAWIDGEETVVRTESEFQARYSRVLDADVKQAIASATVDSVAADAQGIALDGGRVRVRAFAEHRNALRIVSINDANRAR